MTRTERLLRAARYYLAGLLAASWNGGIGAVAGILGIDAAAVTGLLPDANILNLHEMWSAFGGACVLHGIFWLKAHPLPEKWDSTAPFFPTAKGVTPKSRSSSLPELPKT